MDLRCGQLERRNDLAVLSHAQTLESAQSAAKTRALEVRGRAEEVLRLAAAYARKYCAIKKEAMTRQLLPQDLPILEALGLRLQQARERRNIGADLMAERLGATIETLHKLESGDASLDIATLYRVLRILGLSDDLDWLAQDGEMVGKLLSINERE